MRASRVAWALVGVAGAVAVATGAWSLLRAHEQERAYVELAEAASPAEAGEEAWEELDGQNPDAAAWLSVDGTSVDLPVCQASEDDPDWYLYHDLWGNSVDVGNPYLDWRCGPDSPTLCVLGHHTTLSDYMFHDLAGMFDQGRFDSLGCATWTTREGATEFSPLCSTKADRADQTWRRFGWMPDADRAAWLREGCVAASARSADWEGQCERARRVLVLVTCSGWRRYGWGARTITVFTAE